MKRKGADQVKPEERDGIDLGTLVDLQTNVSNTFATEAVNDLQEIIQEAMLNNNLLMRCMEMIGLRISAAGGLPDDFRTKGNFIDAVDNMRHEELLVYLLYFVTCGNLAGGVLPDIQETFLV